MKVLVVGAKGRVGRRVVSLLAQRGHKAIPFDKEDYVETTLKKRFDVIIDFSSAEAFDTVFSLCEHTKKPLVCGTTGLSRKQLFALKRLGKSVPVVYRENFACGFCAFERLLETAQKLLAHYDVEIVETHRKEKKDAPSGSAKRLAKILKKNSRTVHSLRLGTVFGVHCVVFARNGESITVTHNAENVDVFALGAIEEAEILIAKRNRS